MFGILNGGTIINLGVGTDNSIIGNIAVGGIAGYLYNGSYINNCYNKSVIEGYSSGGIVGFAEKNCVISNSYNIGNIISTATDPNLTTFSFTGGICGYTVSSTIEFCYNQATVSGGFNVNNSTGGITGKLFNGAIVQNCYNTGIIEIKDIGGKNVGGIAGNVQDSELSYCYNIANVTGTNIDHIGGITGNVYGTVTISNNYYKENIINGTNGVWINGIEVKTESEMKELHSLLGEAFKKDTNNINNGYPILTWQ